jgi:PAS domain S-box-containing protein
MLVFFVVKTSVLFEIVPSTSKTRGIEYLCFLSFMPLFWLIMKDFIKKGKDSIRENRYISELNSSLIWQARSECFYVGDTSGSAKLITREISVVTEADRVSVWLYSENKESIICDQLYVKSDNRFYSGTELFKNDFPAYFNALESDPIIVANDAEHNPATSCFTESYLKPLGIKSMLDVPIWYKGQVIGVVCTENLKLRNWKECEVAYMQMLSSLYSFGFSVKESMSQEKKASDLQDFINVAALVSIADENGKIIYANKKFTEVSGWSLEELVGKDHNVVNSGEQSRDYWSSMYKKVLAGEIWNDVVTNKAKDGHIYYVDTYIKASFDEKGKLKGFTSIRQDVTEIVKAVKEIEKKNTYLEHAAKIIRHDMHSGINTYIPRGISSLERRLDDDQIRDLKIEAPLKMIKEGLRHTQKVYKGVYEFTNLVKKDSVLNRQVLNVSEILQDYLSATAYRPQVIFDDLGFAFVNEALFCTALDNLIRNGLKYNDSLNKTVKIRRESNYLYIEDNGRGMSQEEFKTLSKPYKRKEGQKESGSGLGLNICLAILGEHGFSVSCDKLPQGGTQMKIKIS